MELLRFFLYGVFDPLFADSRTIIVVLVLLFKSLRFQTLVFSVVEAICIAVSVLDVFITGSFVSALLLALLLAPRIPFAYAGILCAVLSAAEIFITGNIAPGIVTALLGGYILFKNRKLLTFSLPSPGICGIRICAATTNKRTRLFACFLIFWLVRGTTFATGSAWEDYTQFSRNLLFIKREVPIFIAELIMYLPESFERESQRRQQSDEEWQLIQTEDPERVRILRNEFSAYVNWNEEFAGLMNRFDVKETIELSVTPTRIRPGERVHFEAVPSSETPALGASVMLVASPLGYTTTLSNRWLTNKYQSSLKFERTGVYNFTIATRPRFDRNAGKMIAYRSNHVSVTVAPESEQLSRIFFLGREYITPEREYNFPLRVFEGSTAGLQLYGEGLKGGLYNITSPEMGTYWSIEDESKVIVTKRDFDNATMLRGLASGRTRITARYGSLETQAYVEVMPRLTAPARWPQPSSAERPRAVSPPDGFVARVGERLQLEVTPFDVSQGYTFIYSCWSVYRISPKTGERGREVAFLRRGNSEKAEWIPRGTGTFEWEVTYHYAIEARNSRRVISFPQHIVVVN